MKLVIHCGLHKTATTTFQKFCHLNRRKLARVGIHYPVLGRNFQHSSLAHAIQRDGLGVLAERLKTYRENARESTHTILLSGEDFENCIVDVALAAEIETAAKEAGYAAVTWAVVNRDRDELLDSLYAQLSKQGVVVAFSQLKRSAILRGAYYVSTRTYNFIFVLDFPRFRERFEKHISEPPIIMEYRDFVDGNVGMALFEKLLDTKSYRRLCKLANFEMPKQNTRLSKDEVKAKYAATAAKITS